jgi:L-ribulose-5-phosphate 4-epimerase
MGRGAAALREEVYRANMELARSGLVIGTFGNVSGVDRAAGLMAIKPSGVPYDQLKPEHIVPVLLATGEVVDSNLRPSSDTPTHLELYRAFAACGGVVHTHSESATALAQAGLPVRCLGTTHADYFRADVPVTRALTRKEVASDYERNTGLVIVETFRKKRLSPEQVAAVLVLSHGPFTWGADAAAAVENARVLEYVARMEILVLATGEGRRHRFPGVKRPAAFLVDRHYLRKHGKRAYYGQKKK